MEYNDHASLVRLLVCFLHINDSPSDAQVHSLAHALSIDVEELEALIYRMLGKYVEQRPVQTIARRVLASIETDLSKDQKVLIDDYDPDTSTDDEVMLNDSVRAPNDEYNLQEYLKDDGSLEQDDVQDLLKTDGERTNTL